MKTRKLIIKLSIVNNNRYQWSLNANFELITDIWLSFFIDWNNLDLFSFYDSCAEVFNKRTAQKNFA